jgi:acetyl esterase/lipase
MQPSIYYACPVFCVLILLMGCTQPAPESSSTEHPALISDVVYATVEGSALTCDIYFPSSEGVHPAVITVHGGGWRSGDKETHSRIARELILREYVVISINYRLAPAHLFPAAVEDVQCAVVWVRNHAQEYNVDPEAIALLGTSAGAHLAVLAGLTASSAPLSSVPPAPWDISCEHNLGDSRVQAVISCFGPLDLAYHSQENPGTARTVATFLGKSCQKAPSLCAAGNPMTYVSPLAPPMLLIHGTLDDVVGYQNSQRFYHALSEAGGEVTLFPVEAQHGFIIAVSSPQGASAMEAICSFLEAVFSS